MRSTHFSQTFSRTPVLGLLLAPLQMLTAWFVPANRASGSTFARSDAKVAVCARVAPGKAKFVPASFTMLDVPPSEQIVVRDRQTRQLPKPPISRLKILREFDPDISRSCAGRMIISGRMADVCAELDRMEQRERTTSRF